MLVILYREDDGFQFFFYTPSNTDVPEDSSSVQAQQIVQPPSVDPVTALKGQIEEAKAAKVYT